MTDIGPPLLDVPDARAARRGPPERREAICAAVFELLGEVGYDRMTMDAVAARARASKATIYRAWPDKPALVAEALAHRFGVTPQAPDTGSLRGDLMALMTQIADITNGADGEVITGVMTAAARNPALASTLHECTYASKHVIHETVIRRATERGEVHPDPSAADVLHEVLHAMIVSRKLAAVSAIDEAYAKHVVDDVLIPLLTHRKP